MTFYLVVLLFFKIVMDCFIVLQANIQMQQYANFHHSLPTKSQLTTTGHLNKPIKVLKEPQRQSFVISI